MLHIEAKGTGKARSYRYYTKSKGRKKSGQFQFVYNRKRDAFGAMASDARDYKSKEFIFIDHCGKKDYIYTARWTDRKKKFILIATAGNGMLME